MVEQFDEARQHNVLHSVLRSDDHWDSLQASARYLSIVCSRLAAVILSRYASMLVLCWAFFYSVCIYLFIAILALEKSKNACQGAQLGLGAEVILCVMMLTSPHKL